MLTNKERVKEKAEKGLFEEVRHQFLFLFLLCCLFVRNCFLIHKREEIRYTLVSMVVLSEKNRQEPCG